MFQDGGADKKKTEELKRLLAEDRRASKKAIGKLQRERNRFASPHDSRDSLLKELEQERMMRLGTEQRLQEVQLESDSCRMRLHALQEEFRKMEEIVANMLQYKAKIDQLKQENASMKSSYEANLQKYCSHISNLERDNMMLRNQVKKMEAQLHGKGDERDKSKLLLERLKMVEAENSSLVLENEQQRQQYEKCLDEIANQVVQALLAQKTLREECLKLQTRVHDLELQNKHLNILFQQRFKFTSDPMLQVQQNACFATSHVCQTSSSASGSTAATALSPEEITNMLGNASSLQSMCSEIMGDDSPGKSRMSSPPTWMRDKLLASSGPDRDVSPGSTASSTSTASPPTPDARENIVQTKIETEFPATNSSPRVKHIRVYERRARSLDRGLSSQFSWARRTGRRGNRGRRGSDSPDTSYSPEQRLKQSTSADGITDNEAYKQTLLYSQLGAESVHFNRSSSQDKLIPQSILQSLPNDSSPAVFLTGANFNHKSFVAFNKHFEKLLAKNSSENISTEATGSVSGPAEAASATAATSVSLQKQLQVTQSGPPLSTPGPPAPSSQASVAQKLAAQKASSNSPVMRSPFGHSLKSPKSVGSTTGQYYYYDYSDEDSDSRPVSRDFSIASTMSLNELLDTSAEGEVALDDDFFSDWSSICISPKNRIDCLSGVRISNTIIESKHRSKCPSPLLVSCSVSSTPDASRIHTAKIASFIDTKLKQDNSVSKASEIQVATAHTNDAPSEDTSSQKSQATKEKDSSEVSETSSHDPISEMVESLVTEEPHAPKVTAEPSPKDIPIYFLSSPSPSPNLSQRSQDLGYASKGSCSHSSPSPSPSMPHRVTTSSIHSSKYQQMFSGNELLTHIVNKETDEASSPSGTGLAQIPKLARPGQLILAPQDNSFSFQGFSSASSASSEDKSPLKIFEAKQVSDMKSSVIEVKKDGTIVRAMRSIEDSSSETSSMTSSSPCSPVKLPSKIPPPVAKKPTRIVKPELRPVQKNPSENHNKDPSQKFPGTGATNITVGFLLNHQVFPEPAHLDVGEDIKNKSSSQLQDPGSYFQTKCQSSDSSFENLRVERSGSKDDGYSTMSSDIHPEMLEKFGDTFTHRISTNDAESQGSSSKSTAAEASAAQKEARKMGLTLHCRDRSFEFTSDPDSAMETSVHSTIDMVTSSSSQVSTSSSDHPLSPCCTNVSKIARLFDAENTKLNFVHGGSASSSCKHKDNSSCAKTSSTPSSPGSPNAFVPSCYQPPESPRRLAMEFQKFNTAKSPASPGYSRKVSPASPNSTNKSFSGSSQFPQKKPLSANASTNAAPDATSGTKMPEMTLPILKKQLESKTSSPSGIKSLPKGFYNSALPKGKTVMKPSNGAKTQTKQAAEASGEAARTGPATVTSEIGTQDAGNRKEGPNVASAVIPGHKKSQPASSITSVSKDKKTAAESSANKSNKTQCKYPAESYAKTPSNTNVATCCKSDKQKQTVPANSSVTDTRSSNDQKGATGDRGSSNVSHYTYTDAWPSDGPASISHVDVAAKTNNVINQNSCVLISHSLSKASADSAAEAYDASLQSSSRVITDASIDQSHLACHYSQSTSPDAGSPLPQPVNQMPQSSSRIILTNQGFQQFSSDSENNDDDDSASLPSLTFDDNVLEDIPEENDAGDNFIINNIRDLNCNLPTSNNSTTNGITTPTEHQPVKSTTSSHPYDNHNDSYNSITASFLDSSGGATTHQSSSNSRQQQCPSPSISFHQHPFPGPLALRPNILVNYSHNVMSSIEVLCLRRSKSEHDLSSKSKSTSSYDYFTDEAWDSSKVLERSTSMPEIDFLCQRSWLYAIPHGQYKQGIMAGQEVSTHHELPFSNQLRSTNPSSVDFPQHPKHYGQVKQDQQHHHLQNVYTYCSPSGPWVQTLRLDLSDVTELDEEGSELATTRDSLDSSHLDIVSDDSPRGEVDEQKRFNSQFYSLCKFDSSRSLLSSGNESRDRLSMSSLNEILINKSFDQTADHPAEHSILEFSAATEPDEGNEIAIREFDEISRQIANLSKTVDQLNQSLSSLNSGEFEPTRHRHLESSPLQPPENRTRSGTIDGYHWLDDEFLLTSSNGEVIFGGSDLICDNSFGEMISQNSLSDVASTEDATCEFYQVPLSDHPNYFSYRDSAGQDEIFAGSRFGTVKERPTVTKRRHQIQQRSGSDGNLRKKNEAAEKRFSMPIFHRNILDGEADKDTHEKSQDESMALQILEKRQGDDQMARLTGSSNDSDDSLASDIGLDHMMCQRLFGRKGRFQLSSCHRSLIDFAQFFRRYGNSEKEAIAAFDFLDSLTLSESMNQKHKPERSNLEEGGCTVGVFNNNYHAVEGFSEDVSFPFSLVNKETCFKDMRDVGVDAMSQSLQSLDASFETFDQASPGSDPADAAALSQPPARCGSYSMSEASLNHSFGYCSSVEVDRTSSTSIGNTAVFSPPSVVDMVAQSGCETSLLRHSPREQPGHKDMTDSSNPCLMTYTEFVADLKPASWVDEAAPPKLPPRRPIFSNCSLDQDIAPLPQPPPCLSSERFSPSQTQHQQYPCAKLQQPSLHVPYVNQLVPVLTFQHSKIAPRPVSDPVPSGQIQAASRTTPPPLPPRQPHISHTQDGRPQVLVRPQRSNHQGNSKPHERPHSFNHYLINKPRAASSTSSPAHLATYPRSRSHSDTSAISQETPKDVNSESRIPRRKLKTRRERSQLKHSTGKTSIESTVKTANTSGNGGQKQWRDVKVAPASDSSCEDVSS